MKSPSCVTFDKFENFEDLLEELVMSFRAMTCGVCMSWVTNWWGLYELGDWWRVSCQTNLTVIEMEWPGRASSLFPYFENPHRSPS